MGGFLKKKRLSWVAAAFSFLIYLLPLPGHGGFVFLGEALFMEGPPGSGIDVNPKWMAGFAIALVLQGLAGALFYWFLRRPSWRRALMLPVGGVAIVIVGVIAMFSIIPLFQGQ